MCIYISVFVSIGRFIDRYKEMYIKREREQITAIVVGLQITTGYNLEDDRCECVALQDYKENEQVRDNAASVIKAKAG